VDDKMLEDVTDEGSCVSVDVMKVEPAVVVGTVSQQ